MILRYSLQDQVICSKCRMGLVFLRSIVHYRHEYPEILYKVLLALYSEK